MAFSDEVRARLDADAGQIIARYPRSRSAMLPLLHLLQAEEGHISDDGIAWCADQLGLAESEVASVVSFYTMFKRHPVGEYHVGVCTNTLCAILGGDEILASLREHLGVMLSKNSQLTITTGAKSQAALHSTCSRLTLPSGVASSSLTPRCSCRLARISSPPRIAHSVLVHTPTWYSPTGCRLNMV